MIFAVIVPAWSQIKLTTKQLNKVILLINTLFTGVEESKINE
jgi:hypothetical protein